MKYGVSNRRLARMPGAQLQAAEASLGGISIPCRVPARLSGSAFARCLASGSAACIRCTPMSRTLEPE